MPTNHRKKINVSILIPFAIVALVFGAMVWKKLNDSREVSPVPNIVEPAAVRKGVLFFAAGGTRLVREARELESCGDTAECLKDLLEELFSGPVGDLGVVIPESAAVNGVHLDGDTAVIDLNRPFADDLPSGSSAEMLAVYSLVDTVCVNFPQVARVRLTIEGDQKAQLKHLDLSDPLSPDYSLEQETAPKSTSETQKGKQ